MPRQNGSTLAIAGYAHDSMVEKTASNNSSETKCRDSRTDLHTRFAGDGTQRPQAPADLPAAQRADHVTEGRVADTGPELHPSCPLRVLVAEDNVVNQKVARRMLERLGLRGDVAGNGREAVQMMTAVPYDVILMDCQMPEMNGYEAAREIRRRERPNRRVAIIAMTADASTACRDDCLAAGMDAYIAKPVKLEQLKIALLKVAPSEASPDRATP